MSECTEEERESAQLASRSSVHLAASVNLNWLSWGKSLNCCTMLTSRREARVETYTLHLTGG